MLQNYLNNSTKTIFYKGLAVLANIFGFFLAITGAVVILIGVYHTLIFLTMKV
jgi:hypothetical protein